MGDPAQVRVHLPQPLTFAGVASFALAPARSLMAVVALCLLIAAGSVTWFGRTAWMPVIAEAIQQLPEGVAIRRGEFVWPANSPPLLAENAFVSIVADPAGVAETGPTADIQLLLGKQGIRLQSLFGYLEVLYPPAWGIELRHEELEAWWGAWRLVLLGGLFAGTSVGLLMTWLCLGLMYSFPVRLLAFLFDRRVTWVRCWKLAIAAVLPGSLLLSGAIFFYGFHRLNLFALLVVWLAHITAGWVYAGLGPLWLPRVSRNLPALSNPFTTETGGQAVRAGNPFSGNAENLADQTKVEPPGPRSGTPSS